MRHRLAKFVCSLAVASAIVVAPVGPARAATPEQVDAAILKGQAFLLRQINKDANCEVAPEMA